MFLQILFLAVFLAAASAFAQNEQYGPNPYLPEPYATDSARRSADVIGWPDGVMPTAPAGFRVQLFAGGLDNPRSLYVLPNGDVLSAEAKTKIAGIIGSSADQITLMRDGDGDGITETKTVFLDGLKRPFGITLIGDSLYVANTDGLYVYPYTPGATRITAKGKKILDLPAGGYNHHWTRNLLASPDGRKIYISVGSASNNAEYGLDEEIRRANILEINPDGGGEKIFAFGLRNPVGMDWNPVDGTLWSVINERDKLGDDLVPDYMTAVKEGGFYGWPFSYFGQHPDPRMKGQRPDLVAQAISPDYALGSHTAPLGLAFYDGEMFPARYRNGAFIAQHGSWNRSAFVGYRVIFVPFKDGKPLEPVEDFLTGFMKDRESGDVYGRPVSVAVAPDGALLVADDAGNSIWRVSKAPK
ncbi:MAG: PQQ-dependent sugar dehydrogenase [Micavibrio sp.]